MIVQGFQAENRTTTANEWPFKLPQFARTSMKFRIPFADARRKNGAERRRRERGTGEKEGESFRAGRKKARGG